jgi:AAA domain
VAAVLPWCRVTRHVYSPGADGFCGVCQQADSYCPGTRTAPRPPRPERPATAPPALTVVANGHKPAGRQVVVTLASQIKPRPVRWLWPDRIPAGALTLLAGREGIGKSLVGVHLAAQLTRGTLPGSRHGKPSRVMFATSEDAWEFTMVPRLLAAGADLEQVGRVQVDDDGMVLGLTTPVDVPALKAYIADHDVAMLVLDPLTSVMASQIDAHRDREVRTALEPLSQLAEDTGAAVLGLVHLGKGIGADPVNLILGSRAFSAVARVALVAARDPDDEASNVLSVEKSNLGRIDVPALTYRVDGVEIATDEGPAGAGLLVWTGETDRRVRDIMADAGEERGERDEAAEWLTGYLMHHGCEAKAGDAIKAARADGIAERTLKRARARAGVTSQRRGFGQGAVWVLDPFGPRSGQSGQDSGPGTNGPDGGTNDAEETP